MAYNKELYDFQEKIVKDIDDLMKSAGLSQFELKEIIQETVDKYPDWKENAEKFGNYWKTVREYDDFEDINKFFNLMGKVIALAQKRKIEMLKEKVNEKEERDRKMAEKIKEIFNQKNESPAETPPANNSFDEETKNKYIEETERDLKKHNISDQRLNEKLGVNDWKSEMNKSSGWSSAQTFRFSIQDAITKITREIVCDYCKETKSPIIDYDIPSKKKKFCSFDCQNAWEKENNDGNTPSKNTGSKKYSFSIAELFSVMKAAGIDSINIDPAANQIIVKYKNNTTGKLEDSTLPSKLKSEVKRELEATQQPISFSQINSEYNREKGLKDKGGNGGIIAAILIVGILFVGIISVVVYKSRKKDY